MIASPAKHNNRVCVRQGAAHQPSRYAP
jgi:hypothetical protein